MTCDPQNGPTESDFTYQKRILQEVSRTYALTIPQLPSPLCELVSNAYLLCRIADTIEDEPELSLKQKQGFLVRFVKIVAGDETAESFAGDLGTLLSSSTASSEHDLVSSTARIIRITKSFSAVQRRALERCLTIMSTGMVEFQQNVKPDGLDDMPHLDRYCYHVAGVVAEMLAELFCDYSEEVNERCEELFALSTAYGQGLQMTNILKDIWDDQRNGACWLPRDLFLATGFELRSLAVGQPDPDFIKGLFQLVAITRRHLAGGLQFILVIPSRETGIRRHLLWTLGISVLMLRQIYFSPSFKSGQEITLSRRGLRAITIATSLLVRSDFALKLLFGGLTRNLPRSE